MPIVTLRVFELATGASKVSSGWLDTTKTVEHTSNRAKQIPISYFVISRELLGGI